MADHTLPQPLEKTLASPLLMGTTPLKKNGLPYQMAPFSCIFHVYPATERILILQMRWEILIVPFFHSVTAQLSGMSGETGQNDSCSSHRRAESGEQVSLQSLCALGVLICMQRLPVPSSPASETHGCGFHLGAAEFMGRSSLCNVCASEMSRT